MPRTPNLSDLQLVILTHATKHDDRLALPLPDTIPGGVRTRTALADLLRRRLLVELEVAPRVAHWREEGERRIGLVVSDAGAAAIGVDPSDSGSAPRASSPPGADASAHRVATPRRTPMPRAAPKRTAVIALLARPGGATLADICGETAWLAHSARAFLTTLRKQGHSVVRTRSDAGTHYALVEGTDAQG
jgi:hypothetical protein